LFFFLESLIIVVSIRISLINNI